MIANVFVDTEGRPRCIRGVSVMSGSTRLAELAILCGFDLAWLDMEHTPISLSQAEVMCMAVASAGGIPLIRVPANERPYILGALEVGARLVVVPMVNDAEQARRVVEHGKFPPLGRRGINSGSRGNRYGFFDSVPELMAASDHGTYLFAQIETRDAVDNLEHICRVEGLAGIFIGPSDLSLDCGWPGQLNDARTIEMATTSIHKARSEGLHAGIFAGPGPLLEAAREAGANLIVVGGDVSNLKPIWSSVASEIDRLDHFARA